jgi:subtilisin family serine protease
MKKVLFVLVAVSVILGGLNGCNNEDEFLAGDSGELKKAVVQETTYPYVPGEMIVKFREGVAESRKSEIMKLAAAQHKERILTDLMEQWGEKEGITIAGFSGNIKDAISRMKSHPEVEYAEPNYIYTHTAVSNDLYYTNGSLWGMYGDASPLKTNPYGSQAAEAWNAGHTGAATVYIGVIDEGYMYTHEDLSANAGKNPGEIAGNRKDDDKNGYVDDVYGWDFAANNSSVFDGVQDDHGTHVSGTIGAVGGNSKGVAGVCWQVKILNAKFLGVTGGTTTNAVKAVDYFTALKTRTTNPVNIVALNNSWGGGGFSQALYDAIGRANAAGILFICAAGNGGSDGVGDNNDTTPYYPCCYTNSNVISVAAITSSGTLASFSNYGLTTVDIGAPGNAVYSTIPKSSGFLKTASAYSSYSGTSMATPHVTGAAALYASTHPGATAAQIKAAILGSAVPTSSLSGKCVSGGRLNVSGF